VSHRYSGRRRRDEREREQLFDARSKDMKSEIILSSNEWETRLALVEDGLLVELHVERADKTNLVGRIYKAETENVVKGLRGAFVNIGLRKNGFLPLAEIPEFDAFEPELEMEPSGRTRGSKPEPTDIQIKEGQEILVQVVKEPISEKGARVTSYISLPGRYLVYFAAVDRIGISRRVRDRRDRVRLRDIARRMRRENVGLIIRTAAETATEEEIRAEYQSLEHTWDDVVKRGEAAKAPSLLYEEPGIGVQLVRDLFTNDVRRLVVDSKPKYHEILNYLNRVAPSLASKLFLYSGDQPIMEHYGIEAELEKIYQRRLWLKSGGFLTIDQTEALVAIDVNTGRSSKEEDPEKLILSTNLEAAGEIARQIRLRDLSGLILIDFIDMEEQKNTEKVVTELRKHLVNDRSKADFSNISRFGLLEMTRERTRPGLLFTLCETCPTCKGLGRVKSRLETALKIERFMMSKMRSLRGRRVKIAAAPSVAEFLSTEYSDRLGELARTHEMTIETKADPELLPTEFKLLTEL
jgi:ribonuclease G